MKNLYSADNCDVSGDADMLAGSYTPEEMVSTVIRVQGMFLRVELTFHDLVIEFPAEDNATANFIAVLVGKTVMDGEGEMEAGETRVVTSRMRNVDGKWLFTAFELEKLPGRLGRRSSADRGPWGAGIAIGVCMTGRR